MRLGRAVLLFIERVGRGGQSAGSPAVAGVAHNPEEPRSSIAAAKSVEVAKGAEGRLLHDILRILFIPHQPACEATGDVEVRKHDGVEALARLQRGRLIAIGLITDSDHFGESRFERWRGSVDLG